MNKKNRSGTQEIRKSARPARTSPARSHRNPIPVGQAFLLAAAAKNGRPTKGAFGKKLAGVTKRVADHARSCAQANELSQAKRLERAYREFYATQAGKKFAKEFGKTYSDSSPRRSGAQSDCDPQFCDPADLPAASFIDHPVDHIEPESGARAVDGLSEEQITIASEIFSDVLRWGLNCDGASCRAGIPACQATRNRCPTIDSPLVERGKRSIVLIAFMRPDLAADKIDKTLSADFLKQFGSKLAQLEAAGLLFGRYLEWMRRSSTFSAYGERLDITAYMLRPDLLPASTLAKLGEILNKSRQAKDKLANCARDTFSGLKANPMRNDITRARCRASQLQILS